MASSMRDPLALLTYRQLLRATRIAFQGARAPYLSLTTSNRSYQFRQATGGPFILLGHQLGRRLNRLVTTRRGVSKLAKPLNMPRV